MKRSGENGSVVLYYRYRTDQVQEFSCSRATPPWPVAVLYMQMHPQQSESQCRDESALVRSGRWSCWWARELATTHKRETDRCWALRCCRWLGAAWICRRPRSTGPRSSASPRRDCLFNVRVPLRPAAAGAPTTADPETRAGTREEPGQLLRLRLTNRSADRATIYKVKTTAPKRYRVNPNAAEIQPGQTVEVKGAMSPQHRFARTVGCTH